MYDDPNFGETDPKKRDTLLTDEELKAAGITLNPGSVPSITGDITVTPKTSDSIPTSSLGKNVKVPPDVTPTPAQLQTLQSLSPPEAVVNPNFQAPSIISTSVPSPQIQSQAQKTGDPNFESLDDKKAREQQAILDKAKSEEPTVPLPSWLGPLSKFSTGFVGETLSNLNPINIAKGLAATGAPYKTFNIGGIPFQMDPITSAPLNIGSGIINQMNEVADQARQSQDPADRFWKSVYSGIPVAGSMMNKMYDAIRNKDWEGLGSATADPASQVIVPEVYKYALAEGGPQALSKIIVSRNKARIAQLKGYDEANLRYVKPDPDPTIMWETDANRMLQNPMEARSWFKTNPRYTQRVVLKKLVKDAIDYPSQTIKTDKIIQELDRNKELYKEALAPDTLENFRNFIDDLGEKQAKAFKTDYGTSYWVRRLLVAGLLEPADLAMFHSPLGAAGMATASGIQAGVAKLMQNPSRARFVMNTAENPANVPFFMNASPAIQNLFRGATATNLLNPQTK